MTIVRDPGAAEREDFDLIVVGGGIHGAALLLEAAARGLRAVLVERDDFGAATSAQPLRIVHGGLRYLQHADLGRHRESTRERRWFLRSFPALTEPLPCLMPLHWNSVRNPLTLGAAAWLDARLSARRNRGVAETHQIPAGRLLSGARLDELLPAAHRRGERSALLWYDGFMPQPSRLLLEILHRACAQGALALNYVEARELRVSRGQVAGVLAVDAVGGRELELRASRVVNAAGPGVRALAARWDRDHAPLFRPTLAFNLLLDVPPPSAAALAVRAPRPGAPTYFLVPWEGRLRVGTVHLAAHGAAGPVRAPAAAVELLLRDLSDALPGLGRLDDRILRVYAGLLPGVATGSPRLARHPTLVDHGAAGGPGGLFSVSGVKFTTARRVAARALARAFPGVPERAPREDEAAAADRARRLRFGPAWSPGDAEDEALVRQLVADEAVVHLDDLLLRRTALGDDPRVARALAPVLAGSVAPFEPRRTEELERLGRFLDEAVAFDA